MKTLTDEEMENVCVSVRSIAGIEVCRAIEQAILERIGEPSGYICKVGLPCFQKTLLKGNDPSKWTPLFAIKGVE
jgi:hypothetical protein